MNTHLIDLVELWHDACRDFVALARDIPHELWDQPTDLEGWTVKDNVAHVAHLEAVLAGAPEDAAAVDESPSHSSLASAYTEQGVLTRRARDMESLVAEIERSVSLRYAALCADPPTDGTAPAPNAPGGVGWNVATLLSNRPFDVWVHEQDIRRAIGRPGGFDSARATHALSVLGKALPMVVGKRLAPAPGVTVRLRVPEAGLDWAVQVGDDHRATPVESEVPATTTVTLSAEDFLVLGCGRRSPDQTHPEIVGDEELGRRLLPALRVTP